MDEEIVDGEEPVDDEQPEETAELAPASDLPPEVRRHMERQSRRIEKLQRRLAQSEVRAEHGDAIAELVAASGLPPDKWGEFAKRLVEMIPRSAATADEEPSAGSEEEPTPEEQRLATVAQTVASAGAQVPPTMSPKDILELGRRDPEAALRQIRAQYRSS